MIVLRLFGSSLFSLGMILSTLVIAPLSLLTFPFPFETRYRFVSQWARFNLWWLKITCRIDFQLEGEENIPDSPAIIFCKHQSAWETLALQRVFPAQVWVLKRELLWVPFFGWGLAMLEPIAIDRGAGTKAIKQLLKQGKARLKAGRWVVIFPEGTRVAPGDRKRFRMGGALLAASSRYPVVPVAHNAGSYWRKRGFLKRPGTIRMVIGPVIETRGRKAEEINRLAEEWIENKVAELEGRPRIPGV